MLFLLLVVSFVFSGDEEGSDVEEDADDEEQYDYYSEEDKEQAEMPPRRVPPPARVPVPPGPPPAAVPAAPVPGGVDGLAAAMANTTLTVPPPYKPFDFSFRAPVIFTHTTSLAEGHKVVYGDYLVPTVHVSRYKMDVIHGGEVAALGMTIPKIFADMNARADIEIDANRPDQQAYLGAYRRATHEIKSSGFKLDNIVAVGNRDTLPFRCQQRPVMMHVLHTGDDALYSELMNNFHIEPNAKHQMFCFLRVKFISLDLAQADDVYAGPHVAVSPRQQPYFGGVPPFFNPYVAQQQAAAQQAAAAQVAAQQAAAQQAAAQQAAAQQAAAAQQVAAAQQAAAQQAAAQQAAAQAAAAQAAAAQQAAAQAAAAQAAAAQAAAAQAAAQWEVAQREVAAQQQRLYEEAMAQQQAEAAQREAEAEAAAAAQAAALYAAGGGGGGAGDIGAGGAGQAYEGNEQQQEYFARGLVPNGLMGEMARRNNRAKSRERNVTFDRVPPDADDRNRHDHA